jgi:hypothetical protein
VLGFAPAARHHASTTTTLLNAEEGSTVSGPPYSGPAVKPILDSINYPQDMNDLDLRQLKQVRDLQTNKQSIKPTNNSIYCFPKSNKLNSTQLTS